MATDLGIICDPAAGGRITGTRQRGRVAAPAHDVLARRDAAKCDDFLAASRPLTPPGGRDALVAPVARRMAGRGRR